jgi:hypothetical protein
VNSDAKVAAAVFSGLLLAGLGLRPVAAWSEAATRGPEGAGPVADYRPLMGRGWGAAVLGGFRALVADGLWLKTYRAWSAGNLPATQTLIHLVTIVDDRPVFFWLNGARMLAYDMTQWRLAQTGAVSPPPAAVRRRIAEEQAALALQYLEEARRRHPDNAALCVEMAHIHLNLRADVAAAARCYRQAAELPDAPRYAARIHAQLLRRLGRPREAYLWLCRLHPTLPARDPEAMPDVVLRRIRDLEQTLAIPAAERYAAPAKDGLTCEPRWQE